MKKLSRIFLILTVLLMAAPALAMPFFQGAANTEKRELSKLPAIIQEDGSFNHRFSVEMNTWIQEHIGFRNLLISTNSRLRTALFGQGATDDIIVGREGWLFYQESLNDFLHVPTITSRQAAGAARTWALFQEYAEEQESRFLLAFLPNKNGVYGEYMPYYYVPLKESEGNRELFLKALKEEGVSFVDVREDLKEPARSSQLYQKQDSHWTYEGALWGYRSIMGAAGLPFDSFPEMSFTAQKNWPADLAVYLYGEGAQADVQMYPDFDFTYSYKSRTTAVDSLTLETFREGGEGSLVIYRDSFLNTMQVYLAQSFGKALFSRALPYEAELIRRQGADLTILQVTERSLGSFVFRAPRMEALERELEGEARGLPASYARTVREESGELVHLCGSIRESLLGENYRVYLLLGEPDKARAFEAFPIYEKELLGEAPVMDNGFSIYLPGELMAGQEPLSLVVESGGARYLIPIGEAEKQE